MASELWPRVLRRRWYVVALGLLVTVALGFGASQAAKPTYEAKSVLLLLPPSSGNGDNPYLNLGAISGVTDVLNQALSGPEIDAQMHAQGLDGSFQITGELFDIVVDLSVIAGPAGVGGHECTPWGAGPLREGQS